MEGYPAPGLPRHVQSQDRLHGLPLTDSASKLLQKSVEDNREFLVAGCSLAGAGLYAFA